MLLVDNLNSQYKVIWKMTETLAHWYSSESTHESYLMNTNMAGLKGKCTIMMI